ncbi:DUF4160 domain-containing protein [Leptolyngbya sp. FACHB-60]|nr:DUF4160 domain-containing protein [Phormidium sp. FACHB-77]MBD2029341.1 DUF4160 domain-containing protein [Phormidium sp. FACHB-322]MBD2053200.1 DUF4160 domain-containing protein [Leptolyngbya sp. FACHB-60]
MQGEHQPETLYGDHPPPHFHAIYGEYNALVSIESLEIIESDLPNRAQEMVIDWAEMYQQDLPKRWNDQEFWKLPPLKKGRYRHGISKNLSG